MNTHNRNITDCNREAAAIIPKIPERVEALTNALTKLGEGAISLRNRLTPVLCEEVPYGSSVVEPPDVNECSLGSTLRETKMSVDYINSVVQDCLDRLSI